MKDRYRLLRPVEPKQGEAITEVLIAEPDGSDLEVLDEFLVDGVLVKPMGYTLTMIERLCRYPNGDPVFPGFARKLKAVDVDKLGELVMATLPDGQTTGGTA